MKNAMPDLTYLATQGAEIAVRVTPKAARNAIEMRGREIRIYVTTVPEGGKATAAAVRLLARALDLPKSRIVLVRGAASRNKVFRIK